MQTQTGLPRNLRHAGEQCLASADSVLAAGSVTDQWGDDPSRTLPSREASAVVTAEAGEEMAPVCRSSRSNVSASDGVAEQRFQRRRTKVLRHAAAFSSDPRTSALETPWGERADSQIFAPLANSANTSPGAVGKPRELVYSPARGFTNMPDKSGLGDLV